MSVLLPYQYKYLADKLGQMYAKIRDAVFNESDSDSAYNLAQNTLKQESNSPVFSTGGLDAESDGTTWGCTAAGSGESEDPTNENYSVWIGNSTKYSAPPGSVGNDLRSFWFTFANTTFNYENAKSIATAQVGNALRRLNTHILRRMAKGPTLSSITTMAQYYSEYAFIDDSTATSLGLSASQLSLFDLGSESGLDSSATYFSQDFAELSARIGVTISSSYVSE